MDYLRHQDPYLPANPQPSLQQYDNYQIHDLVCEDILYQPIDIGGRTFATPEAVLKRSFLAIQAYDVDPISFDFIAVVNQYP